MKGVIAYCLSELVKEKFGKDKWEEALEKAGFTKSTIWGTTVDIDDHKVLNLVDSVCKVLHISLVQAADAFGDYWVNVFAPKVYHVFYKRATSAREMLLMMNKVHQDVTKNLPNAHPPGFDYEWKDEKTLIMKYKSHRNLIDFVVGLAKGVGKYYHEDLKVRKISNTAVEIVFPQ